MAKGSSEWKMRAFDAERKAEEFRIDAAGGRQFIKREDGWILFGPRDVRGEGRKYRFDLQCLKCDKQLRVRVGCRYYTLAQAYAHWGPSRKNRGWQSRRNECAQALVIIQLLLLQAQAYRLIPSYKKLPTLKPKPKRK